MAKDLSQCSERDGTRKLMLGGAVFAAVLFVGLMGWLAVPSLLGSTDYVGRPATGSDNQTSATTVGTGVPTQRDAQSVVARNDPAGDEDTTGGRARNIRQSSQSVSLSEQQRSQLRSILASAGAPRVDRTNFEMMIGTAVPLQTQLADLPPEASQVLKGFSGAQYLIAGKDLVVVDHNSRRVAAIIGGVQ